MSMKIAIINQPWSYVLPPVRSADSIALWTDEVAHRLAKQGCEVTFYSRLSKGEPRVLAHEGVVYRGESVSLDRWLRAGLAQLDERGFKSPQKPFYASKWYYRQFIGGVIEDLRHSPPDIVHIQNFSQFVPMIRRALPGCRILLHMHAEWLAKLDRKMIEPRLQDSDSIIFCSNYFAQQTRDAWPQYAGRCHVVYNGVTLSEFECAEPMPGRNLEAKRILFVGRLSPDKGVHILVDAFEKIIRRFPQAELKIVGPWSMIPKSFCISHSTEKTVRDLLAFYGHEPYVDQLRQRMTPEARPRVDITKGISREDLIRMYQSADVLVLPSIYPEGFGIPIVEAAACQVPAVVTRRGGMPEVVEDGKTGLICEAANVDSLADAILRLLSDESLRRSMGRAAFDRTARLFTWDQIAQSMLDRYRETLNRPTRQDPVRKAPQNALPQSVGQRSA
jgi:glycosyltransferase involved in cell wall biosynthesis